MKRLIVSVLALCAAVACAPIGPPPGPYVPANPHGLVGGQLAGSSGRTYAAQLPTAQGAMYLCPGASTHNIGQVNWNREIPGTGPVIATPAGGLLRNPTEGACVTSGYGLRFRATGGGRVHEGVDLARPLGGDLIFAAGGGRVVSAGWRGSYGYMVEIDHGRGVTTRYGHLREINPSLRPGARVASGLPIGRMGQTGNATGVHLHYEVRIRGRAVNPLG